MKFDISQLISGDLSYHLLVYQLKRAIQPYNKNDKSPARDDTFHIWIDASLQLNIRQFPISGQRVNAVRRILMIYNAAPD
jgi:hypothetical protein